MLTIFNQVHPGLWIRIRIQCEHTRNLESLKIERSSSIYLPKLVSEWYIYTVYFENKKIRRSNPDLFRGTFLFSSRSDPVFLIFGSGFSRPLNLVVAQWSEPGELPPDPQPSTLLHGNRTSIFGTIRQNHFSFPRRAKVSYRNAQNVVHMLFLLGSFLEGKLLNKFICTLTD